MQRLGSALPVSLGGSPGLFLKLTWPPTPEVKLATRAESNQP